MAFTFNQTNPQSQQYVDDPNNPARIGAEVEFDPLAYPYLFSAAAYIDTGETFFNIKFLEKFPLGVPDILSRPTMPATLLSLNLKLFF